MILKVVNAQLCSLAVECGWKVVRVGKVKGCREHWLWQTIQGFPLKIWLTE